MNWRSRRTVLFALAGVCLVMFGGGMAAAWHNRHHTICPDKKVPVAQEAGLLGQTVYKCHDGRIVTTAS